MQQLHSSSIAVLHHSERDMLISIITVSVIYIFRYLKVNAAELTRKYELSDHTGTENNHVSY